MKITRETLNKLGLMPEVSPVEGYSHRFHHEYIIKALSGAKLLIVFTTQVREGRQSDIKVECYMDCNTSIFEMPGIVILSDLFSMCRIMVASNIDMSTFESIILDDTEEED